MLAESVWDIGSPRSWLAKSKRIEVRLNLQLGDSAESSLLVKSELHSLLAFGPSCANSGPIVPKEHGMLTYRVTMLLPLEAGEALEVVIVPNFVRKDEGIALISRREIAAAWLSSAIRNVHCTFHTG